MYRNQIENILKSHIPENALGSIVDLMIKNQVYLNIVKSRSSKYGDFKVSGSGQQPRISINHNLNPYSFLITFLHEIAHLLVWRQHRLDYRRIKPHGVEWKNEFKNLMRPFLVKEVFPDSLLHILKRHMLNPKATSFSDINLVKELKKYDHSEDNAVMLTDLQIGDVFAFKNKDYRIIKKNRSRFLCENTGNKKRYLIHSLAEVKLPQ